jgi:hypothetical protein
MELVFSEVAATGDGEDGEEGVNRVVVEFIWLVVVVVLQVDD